MKSFEETRKALWRELDCALKAGAPNWEVRCCAFALAALREIRSKTDDARRELCAEVLWERESKVLAARVSTQIEREIVSGAEARGKFFRMESTSHGGSRGITGPVPSPRTSRN